MAQVMNYWQYPNTFNWSILKNDYSYSETNRSAYEVAGLMEDIGDNVSMNYGCDESTSSYRRIDNALIDDYGYNENIITDDFYQIDNIKNELIAGRPVILRGLRTMHECCGIRWYENGHAWVADGYWLEYDRYKEVCYTGAGYPI